MTAELSTRPGSALASVRCIIVGVGGLGHPVIAHLLAAGVQRWVLIDPDTVEASNLHRQWLFHGADRSRSKAQVAAQWLLARDPHLRIEVFEESLIAGRPAPFDLSPDDLWFECSDQPALKFDVSSRALAQKAPAVIGGVLGWKGQVFSQAAQPGCYHCLFEAPPPDNACASCEQAGVITSAAAHIGAMMVARAHALIDPGDSPRPPANTLVHIDLVSLRSQVIQAPRKRDCCHCSHLASSHSLG